MSALTDFKHVLLLMPSMFLCGVLHKVCGDDQHWYSKLLNKNMCLIIYQNNLHIGQSGLVSLVLAPFCSLLLLVFITETTLKSWDN